MRKRTFAQRITQLGNIACIEGDMMQARGQHGVMPRTKQAKAILKFYEQNVFGRVLDVCGADRYIAHSACYTNREWQGKQKTNN